MSERLRDLIPAPWRALWDTPALEPHWAKLEAFLDAEYASQTVYPPRKDLFQALQPCPPEAVRVLILGQDPYHQPGQAHGLSFSVPPGQKLPPSLRNIFTELQSDLGCAAPASGSLLPWARQGVLLLNTVMSVRAGQAGSHAGQGWEPLSDALIAGLSTQSKHLVCLLWGRWAQAKAPLIDPRHTILQGPHPSPLSAYRGFFGSRPFSQINAALQAHGQPAIDWALPAHS
ncbi:MAG: uracil-DNA glycosylase [Candidatus Sericytochromatia bacterium]|nr:uracil-DNA glycosylase [Candidatus Sericytochromatia bacterium]